MPRYPVAIERLPSRRVLEFRILGPLEVVGDGGPVPLGGPKQRATLAILLLNANRVVSVERLADDLYAGAPPVTAVTQVQRQVSELRQGARRRAGDRDALAGLPHPRRARAARPRRASSGSTAEAARALARASRGARVELLARGARRSGAARRSPTSPTSRSRRRAIERLEEIRLAALEQRIDAELALGRHARARRELEELVAEHPLRERLRGAADARALPLGPAGRGARGLPAGARGARRGASGSSRRGAPGARARDPRAGPVARARRRLAGERGGRTPRACSSSADGRLDGLDALLALAEPLASAPAAS